MKAIINLLLGVPFQVQANVPGYDKEIAKLDGTIFLPVFLLIILVVIIASIAITSQKHKH